MCIKRLIERAVETRLNDSTQLACLAPDDLLQIENGPAREEWIESSPPDSVRLVGNDGQNDRRLNRSLHWLIEPWVFEEFRADIVNLVIVFRVAQVDLVWGDSDDWACKEDIRC